MTRCPYVTSVRPKSGAYPAPVRCIECEHAFRRSFKHRRNQRRKQIKGPPRGSQHVHHGYPKVAWMIPAKGCEVTGPQKAAGWRDGIAIKSRPIRKIAMEIQWNKKKRRRAIPAMQQAQVFTQQCGCLEQVRVRCKQWEHAFFEQDIRLEIGETIVTTSRADRHSSAPNGDDDGSELDSVIWRLDSVAEFCRARGCQPCHSEQKLAHCRGMVTVRGAVYPKVQNHCIRGQQPICICRFSRKYRVELNTRILAGGCAVHHRVKPYQSNICRDISEPYASAGFQGSAPDCDRSTQPALLRPGHATGAFGQIAKFIQSVVPIMMRDLFSKASPFWKACQSANMAVDRLTRFLGERSVDVENARRSKSVVKDQILIVQTADSRKTRSIGAKDAFLHFGNRDDLDLHTCSLIVCDQVVCAHDFNPRVSA